MKVSIQASFGSGLLENACWTLLWLVFGPFMTGFEVGFDSGIGVSQMVSELRYTITCSVLGMVLGYAVAM